MTNYNEQYYILFGDTSNGASHLRPSSNTVDRSYTYVKLNLSGGPTFFYNSFAEEDKKAGIKHPILDVMDADGWFLFSNRLYQQMATFEINGMQLFPAVFIDDNKKYHENYFLTNFYEELDCLDVDKSNIRSKRERRNRITYNVKELFLSNEILDKIPEEQRLMFRIDKVGDGHILVHQKIKDIIEQENATGAKFFRVDQYKAGDEYRTKK